MTDDLVGRLEAWADNDAKYGHHGRAADWLAAKARIEALEAALRTMIYETTHLSPCEPDGSHWCKISADALAASRQLFPKGPPHAD